MSRRIHACLSCAPEIPTPRAPFTQRRGFTRHKDQVCSRCRASGVRVDGDQIMVPLKVRIPPGLCWVPKVADPARPTLRELADSIDISCFINGWHGTDCPCPLEISKGARGYLTQRADEHRARETDLESILGGERAMLEHVDQAVEGNLDRLLNPSTDRSHPRG